MRKINCISFQYIPLYILVFVYFLFIVAKRTQAVHRPASLPLLEKKGRNAGGKQERKNIRELQLSKNKTKKNKQSSLAGLIWEA